MSAPDRYHREALVSALDLLCRIRRLGLLTDAAEQASDIAGDVESFIELHDEHGHLSHPERCGTCGHLLNVEFEDTPALYCERGCEDEPTGMPRRSVTAGGPTRRQTDA